MADVLPPLMQSSSTITMLHSRPSSADAFQSQPQTSPRLGQAPRSMYNGSNNSFRGSASPVQPYAFQAPPHLRQDSRTSSAPTPQQNSLGVSKPSHGHSASNSSSDGSSAKDDSVIGSREGSLINLSSSIPDLSLTNYNQPVKASPDRYRRPANKRSDSSNTASPKLFSANGSVAPLGSGMASTGQMYQQPSPPIRQTSVDDMALPKSTNPDLAKRYRRRSLNNLETQTIIAQGDAQANWGAERPSSAHASATSTPTTIRPVVSHQRVNSRDGSEYAQRTNNLQPVTSNSSSIRAVDNGAPIAASNKPISIPPRGSSDANKRLGNPSPLSRQANESENAAPKPKTYAAAAQAAVASPSPAAQHLAAVSDKDLNKGMKSRLRRAFSFGSAQELRRASAENNISNAQQAREQQQQRVDDELDAEQLEIARRQEAAGIGAGIYSGQGGFTGSTDNISISSTASSASMMLRKMGKGAKKSARSIKGLFRPKSVIGVPAADGPIQVHQTGPLPPTMTSVSMVTVEAERQKVNVNAEAAEKHDGGTGFPKLDRNSIDVANASARASADGSESVSRRSIVGSDKDRAEVLAAVKKGILKRSGTASPNGSPQIRANDGVPHIESPAPSMPSTPKDGSTRTASFNNGVNGDYFSRSLTNTKSMPNTPNGLSKSISFSPRIQFHDAWSSSEYDRRGEIATCNRLTPVLAQQIKEELNTFKMEMEVHEASKPHTHFF